MSSDMTLFDDLADPPQPNCPDNGGAQARVKMTLAYDGSSFHGFAANPGVRTVAGVLTEALERVLRHPIELTCAGRTDKGVHALGQVVSFNTPAETLDLDKLQRAVNSLCCPTIVVRDVVIAEPDFDARFSARSRLYRYTVLNRAIPDPFLAATSWWVGTPLDLRAMQLGIDPLIGEHDFSSFCRRPKEPRSGVMSTGSSGAQHSLVRRVIDATWVRMDDDVLHFDIEATAFCHQMVRSITGTLVDVGLGRIRAGDVSGILRACDRTFAGTVAPPHGLCLREVRY